MIPSKARAPHITRLEPRLQAVANFIDSHTHVDIGSDHALLPKYLLQTKRIHKAIVIEKHISPFENARAALQGLNADVRLGDGLEPYQKDETESLSISGMGAEKIVNILQSHPERLPGKLSLQPNDNARPIRLWARVSGFHLRAEAMAKGFWRYSILHFEKHTGDDPAYSEINLEAALTYGPHLLKSKHPLLVEELEHQLPYLKSLGQHGAKQLETLERALEIIKGNPATY
jgi:tRNA (adenine22-N1)-methyltransferase